MNPLDLYPPWKNAVRLFLDGFSYGDIVPVIWLRRAFDIADDTSAEDAKENQLKFVAAFCHFRDTLLEEHRIALASVPGAGYRVLHPAEQTRHAARHHMRKVHKEMRHMVKTMAFIRHDELTDAERRENSDAIARAAQLAAMLDKNRITHKPSALPPQN